MLKTSKVGLRFNNEAHTWGSEAHQTVSSINFCVMPCDRALTNHIAFDSFVFHLGNNIDLFHVFFYQQARWLSNKLISRSYDENGSLFTESERETMREDIIATRKAQPEDLPYNYLVDNPGYLDKLSQDIGCNPPAYDDLKASGEEGKLLAVLIRHGPMIATHYRLQGPGKWDGAKNIIIEVGNRVLGEEKIKEYLK